jgi:hypothetical protein
VVQAGWEKERTEVTRPRGSSSFHGIAKQGSYPIRVWRFNTAGLEKVLDLHLALSEVPDILVEIRRAVGLQPLQGSGEPALEASGDCRKLPLDGDLGKVIQCDTERLRGPLKVTERLIVVEVKRERLDMQAVWNLRDRFCPPRRGVAR